MLVSIYNKSYIESMELLHYAFESYKQRVFIYYVYCLCALEIYTIDINQSLYLRQMSHVRLFCVSYQYYSTVSNVFLHNKQNTDGTRIFLINKFLTAIYYFQTYRIPHKYIHKHSNIVVHYPQKKE